MNRMDVTEKIISTKVSKGLKWEDVAKKSWPFQRMDHGRLPGPNDTGRQASQNHRQNFWPEC